MFIGKWKCAISNWLAAERYYNRLCQSVAKISKYGAEIVTKTTLYILTIYRPIDFPAPGVGWLDRGRWVDGLWEFIGIKKPWIGILKYHNYMQWQISRNHHWAISIWRGKNADFSEMKAVIVTHRRWEAEGRGWSLTEQMLVVQSTIDTAHVSGSRQWECKIVNGSLCRDWVSGIECNHNYENGPGKVLSCFLQFQTFPPKDTFKRCGVGEDGGGVSPPNYPQPRYEISIWPVHLQEGIISVGSVFFCPYNCTLYYN